MKVLLRTGLDTMSGFGNDGVGLAMALVEAGHDVHLWPESVTPPIPTEVAQLLLKYPDPPFDLGISHVTPSMAGAKALRVSCAVTLLWTMWEWEQYRWPGWEDLLPAMEETYYDHLLCYDDVTMSAIGQDPLVNPGVPVSVFQGGYQPDYWAEVRPNHRDWSGTFRFVMVGRLEQRKNPWAAVKAFGQLKDEHGDDFDAELVLKTTLPGYLPPQLGERWPGIQVQLGWWPHARLRDLYAQSHCYLAPSTGEGKNVPALEAMTTGIPVIATAYGGHVGWLSEEWAYPLSYTRHEFEQGFAAEADVDHLRELMWHVYTHREEARAKGELAARTIPPMMSWSSVVARLMDVVKAIEPREHPYGKVLVSS